MKNKHHFSVDLLILVEIPNIFTDQIKKGIQVGSLKFKHKSIHQYI